MGEKEMKYRSNEATLTAAIEGKIARSGAR